MTDTKKTETDYRNTGLTVRDLPDCLFVVPEVTRRGGQHYERRDERQVLTSDGSIKTIWTTIKVVNDPAEFAEASQIQNKAKYAFARIGRHVPGGIVVNKSKRLDVDVLVAEWREACDAFNARATTCSVSMTAWVHDVTGSNAANLQAVIDDLKETLDSLESAMTAVDVKGIRDILKKSGGFAELLPETVADRMQTALDSARSKATKLSRAEKKIKRIDAKLAEELGSDDADAYADALDDLLAGPLTADVAKRADRITKLVEDKQSTVDDLERIKAKIDTSSIKLARFAIVGDRNVAEADAPSGDLAAARAGTRFARMTAEAGDAPAGPAPETEETEETETEAKRSMLSDAARARFGRLSA